MGTFSVSIMLIMSVVFDHAHAFSKLRHDHISARERFKLIHYRAFLEQEMREKEAERFKLELAKAKNGCSCGPNLPCSEAIFDQFRKGAVLKELSWQNRGRMIQENIFFGADPGINISILAMLYTWAQVNV